MKIEIVEEPVAVLPAYSSVSIAFLVRSRLRVEPIQNGLGGLAFTEEPVEPYLKDYDAEKGEGPTRWSKRWDLTNWGVLSAWNGSQRVGGAVLAWHTPDLNMLEDRVDLTALWDLRVAPDYRGRGIGTRLFNRALAWAHDRGCRQFKVETQNINVPACRFYVRQGCQLGAVNQYAYGPDLDEVQLLWYRSL